MADLNAIADQLSTLTVMQAAELVKMLEEKWGVSAAAPATKLVRLLSTPGGQIARALKAKSEKAA